MLAVQINQEAEIMRVKDLAIADRLDKIALEYPALVPTSNKPVCVYDREGLKLLCIGTQEKIKAMASKFRKGRTIGSKQTFPPPSGNLARPNLKTINKIYKNDPDLDMFRSLAKS